MNYNINDGRYSPQEVEETFGESIVVVNMWKTFSFSA